MTRISEILKSPHIYSEATTKIQAFWSVYIEGGKLLVMLKNCRFDPIQSIRILFPCFFSVVLRRDIAK